MTTIDRNEIIFKHYYYSSKKDRKNTPQTLAKLLTATISFYTQMAEIVKEKNDLSGSSS